MKFLNRPRLPNLAAAPSSPGLGELYYDTVSNHVFAWDGTRWVDMLSGADWKNSVRVATVGTETFTVAAGAVTLINGLAVDGVTLAVGDRILIKDAPAATGVGSPNSSQPANGIYRVTANATNLTVTRDFDGNATGDMSAATRIPVEEGTVNQDSFWTITTNNPITLNTTAIQFSNKGRREMGTAALPAYSFIGDPNTGVYSSAPDTVNIATNGLNRLQVGPTGTVTIAAPTSGNAFSAAGNAVVTGANGGYSFNDRTGGPPATWMLYASAGLARLWNAAADALLLDVNGQLRLPLAGAGVLLATDALLRREAAGVLASRNAGDTAYGIMRGATPVGVNDLVTKAYADAVIAPGVMAPFPGFTAPSGWLMCDGSSLTRSTQPGLFDALSLVKAGTVSTTTVINMADTSGLSIGMGIEVWSTGTKYAPTNISGGGFINAITPNVSITISAATALTGAVSVTAIPWGGAGAPGTAFNLPNMAGRTPVGVGTSSAPGATAHTLAQFAGEETHTLTAAESGLPAHSHGYALAPAAGVNNTPGYGSSTRATTLQTDANAAANASSAHPNMQPYAGTNWIIKL